MNILLGFTTILIIVIIFRHIEKKPFSKIHTTDLIFSCIVLFLSFIYNPVQYFYFWIGWSFCFYIMLDDLKTKSLRVDVPVYILIYFLVITRDFSHLLSPMVSFLFVYLLFKLSKGAIIKDGDSFAVLPLTFFLPLNELFIYFYLSIVLGAVFLTFIHLRKNTNEYPFVPFLTVSSFLVMKHFHLDFIVAWGTVLSFVCFILIRIKKN